MHASKLLPRWADARWQLLNQLQERRSQHERSDLVDDVHLHIDVARVVLCVTGQTQDGQHAGMALPCYHVWGSFPAAGQIAGKLCRARMRLLPLPPSSPPHLLATSCLAGAKHTALPHQSPFRDCLCQVQGGEWLQSAQAHARVRRFCHAPAGRRAPVPKLKPPCPCTVPSPLSRGQLTPRE